jgi:hypothetical protein
MSKDQGIKRQQQYFQANRQDDDLQAQHKIAQLRSAFAQSGVLPVTNTGPFGSGGTIDPPEPESIPRKYSEFPYAPFEVDNVTYLGATMLDHYTSIALEGLMSNPEHKDTPIPDIVRKAIQTANETCRQLEIIRNLKNG